jgi:ribosomal protein S18 acetylase RimI-like enzyme
MTILKAMKPSSFAAYREAAARGYAEDFDETLPRGLATPGHHLYEIEDETTGAALGVIWFAVAAKNGLESAFVYDVEIKAEFRRQGYARAAFAALEPLVKAMGLSNIGLHVFGHNPGAQALYNSLGYRITGVNMLKKFGKDDA